MSTCQQQCPLNADEFKIEVIESLAALRTDIKSILGNGQPGRLGTAEKKIDCLFKNQNRMIGALILVSSAPVVALIVAILKAR